MLPSSDDITATAPREGTSDSNSSTTRMGLSALVIKVGEVGDVYVGGRVLAGHANAGVHEQNVEAPVVQAAAQSVDLFGVIDVDSLDGKASRKAGRKRVKLLGRPANGRDDLPVAAAIASARPRPRDAPTIST